MTQRAHWLRRHAIALLAATMICVPRPAVSAPLVAQQIRADLVGPLSNAKEGQTLTLRGIPLGATHETLRVEPFSVWAPGASVRVIDGSGTERRLPPPEGRSFRGTVDGHGDSAVYLHLKRSGELTGLILIGERRYRIGRGVRSTHGMVRRSPGSRTDEESPILVSEMDSFADDNPSTAWTCETDRYVPARARRSPEIVAAQSLKPIAHGGAPPGATYTLNLAIHTDYELCAALGSVTATISYIDNLVGEASVIFARDVRTGLQIAQDGLIVVTSPSASAEMQTAPPADVSIALAELGTYWHDNYASVQRSAVVMVSGKMFNAGIAWENTICGDDVYCGDDGSLCGSSDFAKAYSGAYAFCGSSGSVATTTPDPTAWINGVQYALPNNSSYWMLLAFCHEVGHLCNGPHTNCVALTAAEQAKYATTRAWVDQCEGAEPTCYSGTPSSPSELGTIMSLCQNFFATTGYRQSRYTFGVPNEPSEKIPPYLMSAIDAATPLGTIALGGCAGTQTASVPSCTGCSYVWSIDSGAVNSGRYSDSVNFTATAANASLSVTITNAHGCEISTSVSVSPCPLAAPTGVNASAFAQIGCTPPSVQVSWSAVTSAQSYNVYRCSGGCANAANFTLVGSTAALSFPDSGCRTDGLAPSQNTAYLYEVAAAVPFAMSANSAPDLATTVLFTDDPIQQRVTVIKAVHAAELQTAISAVCNLAATTPPAAAPGRQAVVAASYITGLRSALNTARGALDLPLIVYQDDPLNPAGQPKTVIKAVHFMDLRNGVR